MTRPAMEPGESEYSWGPGLLPPERQGATRHGAGQEEFGHSVYDHLKAEQRTDSAEELAQSNFDAEPFTEDNKTGTKWRRVQ